MPDPPPPASDDPTGPVRLPGIGTSLRLHDAEGRPVDVIRRHDGHVEVYPAGDRLELDAAAARSLGAFVTGRYRLEPDTAERLADVVGGLVIDWVHVPRAAASVGRSIAELEVRRRTGVTIIAILRGSQPIVAPDPDEMIEGGDDLVIAGRAEDRDGFEQYLATGR